MRKILELFLSKYKSTYSLEDRINLFQTLVSMAEKYSLDTLAVCFLGYLSWVKGDYNQALAFFQKAIQQNETLSYVWHGLGT